MNNFILRLKIRTICRAFLWQRVSIRFSAIESYVAETYSSLLSISLLATVEFKYWTVFDQKIGPKNAFNRNDW